MSVFPDQDVSMAFSGAEDNECFRFAKLDESFAVVQRKLPDLEGIVVFTGPGRLTLVRGAVSFCMGLAEGRGIPLLGLNIRDMLKLGWLGWGELTVVTEPVRGTILGYRRSGKGVVRRTALAPEKIGNLGELLVFDSARKRLEGGEFLSLEEHPALGLLEVLPEALKQGGTAKFSPSKHLEYARAAV